MVSFTTLFTALAAAAATSASPIEAIQARGIQPGTGTHNGFFYSYWTDGKGSVDYNNGAGGSYNVKWNNVNNWVGGKGWKPGPPRKVAYNGTWNNHNVNSCELPPSFTTDKSAVLTKDNRPCAVRMDHQPPG